MYRIEDRQTSFIVSQRPSKSLDVDCTSVAWEEREEFLDNVSELLSTAPVITQTHDCWQRQTDEVESNAAGTPHHNQSYLKAKRTYDLIDFVTQLMLLIGRYLSPLWNYYVLSFTHVIRPLLQLSIHTNNRWNITDFNTTNVSLASAVLHAYKPGLLFVWLCAVVIRWQKWINAKYELL